MGPQGIGDFWNKSFKSRLKVTGIHHRILLINGSTCLDCNMTPKFILSCIADLVFPQKKTATGTFRGADSWEVIAFIVSDMIAAEHKKDQEKRIRWAWYLPSKDLSWPRFYPWDIVIDYSIQNPICYLMVGNLSLGQQTKSQLTCCGDDFYHGCCVDVNVNPMFKYFLTSRL